MRCQNKEPLRWQVADASRFNQDEYLEWSVGRDPVSQKIVGVELTCEGPEVNHSPYHYQPRASADQTHTVLEILGREPARYDVGPLQVHEPQIRKPDGDG